MRDQESSPHPATRAGLQISDEAVQAYQRGHAAAAARALPPWQVTPEMRRRVDVELVRAGLADAYQVLAEQWHREMVGCADTLTVGVLDESVQTHRCARVDGHALPHRSRGGCEWTPTEEIDPPPARVGEYRYATGEGAEMILSPSDVIIILAPEEPP